MSKLQAESFHNEDLKLHLLRSEQIENKSFNNGRAEAILPTDVHLVRCEYFKLFSVSISKHPEEHNITILTQ